MASIEYQNPRDPRFKHLYKLHPYIICFRDARGPKKHGDDLFHFPYIQEFYKDEFSISDFFEYVDNNVDEIVEELNLRWIISILECYTDGHPDTSVRLQALTLTNLVRAEHIHQSYMYTIGISRQEFIKLHNPADNKTNIVGGLLRYIGDGDLYVNLMWRNLELITHHTLRKFLNKFRMEFSDKWYSLFESESFSEIYDEIIKLKKEAKGR